MPFFTASILSRDCVDFTHLVLRGRPKPHIKGIVAGCGLSGLRTPKKSPDIRLAMWCNLLCGESDVDAQLDATPMARATLESRRI